MDMLVGYQAANLVHLFLVVRMTLTYYRYAPWRGPTLGQFAWLAER